MRVLKVRVISLPYIFHVLYVLCFTRPTYQVSVYRTIGPLVDKTRVRIMGGTRQLPLSVSRIDSVP